MRPDCLCPCAALRANLRHAIQAAVPPNSLRGTPLRSDKRRQVRTRSNAVLRQRCPQPEPRAAGTDRREGTDGLRDLGRNWLEVHAFISVAAIKIDREAIWFPHPVLPLVPTPVTASSWGGQLHRRVQLHRDHFYGNVFERSVEDAK